MLLAQPATSPDRSRDDRLDRITQLTDAPRDGSVAGDSIRQAEANQLIYEVLNDRQSTDRELARAYVLRGKIFERRFDTENALDSYVAALQLYEQRGEQLAIARVQMAIGTIFLEQNDYERATAAFTQASEIFGELGTTRELVRAERALGDVLLARRVYGDALDQYAGALEQAADAELTEEAAQVAAEMGRLSAQIGQYENALIYHRTHLDYASALGDTKGIGMAFTNMAQALIEQRDPAAAADYNAQALSIWTDLSDTLRLAESYKDAARIEQLSNRSDQAEKLLEQSVATLNQLSARSGKPEILREIGRTYGTIGNYRAAYRTELAYDRAREDVYNQEKSRALNELLTKHQSLSAAEEQARRIELLEVEQSNANKIRYALLGILALAALLLFSLYRNFRVKKRDNELLQAKNAEIQQNREEIEQRNRELADTNERLDGLNRKLVEEIAEREALEKSSFARDRFLATMSHEMRTPINIIIGLTHLLIEENPRVDQIDHLRTLQFSANNLVVFINDVLDFSKIEAGKLSLDNREFNPRQTFSEIEQRFEAATREKDLTLHCDFDKNIPEQLLGDPARLNQILTNLLNLSVQESAATQVNLSCQLYRLDQKEAVLALRVSDDGTGLPPDRLNALLQRYSQNPGDVFEGYGSNDLGLAITKRLVELQNGSLKHRNQSGGGLDFTAILPFKLPGNQRNRRPVHRKDVDYQNLNGKRVLLVEDNKINQLVVAKMLRKIGMVVTTADDGIPALEAVNRQDFDLILMDIQMPQMDGYRATAEIRKHSDPIKRDTPIIALTASAFLTEREKARLFGMNDHVGKPFGPEELLEKIELCLTTRKV